MDMTMMESLSRMPPHNMEAEQSVLGCMLLDKESVEMCIRDRAMRIRARRVKYILCLV